MNFNNKLEKLQCTFPKLTEANQHYVLGLVEGLKQAQTSKQKSSQKEVKPDWGKQMGEYGEK